MAEVQAFISPFIEKQFPAFYREEGPQFIEFVKLYYEWLEQSDNIIGKTRQLLNYRDIDRTIEDFIVYFKEENLKNIQFTTESNPRLFVKNSVDFYRSKGTPRNIDLFFKLIYGKPANVYYPGDDLFKLSDNNFIIPTYLEISNNKLNKSFEGKQITGITSKARAFVETYTVKKITNFGKDTNGNDIRVSRDIPVLYISNLTGDFLTGETIIHDGIQNSTDAPKILGSLSSVAVLIGASDYKIGDVVDLISENGINGKALVKEVISATGQVIFELLDGGWGYSEDSFSVMSEFSWLLRDITPFTGNNIDPANPSIWTQFETIYQPLANIGFTVDSGFIDAESEFTVLDKDGVPQGTFTVLTTDGTEAYVTLLPRQKEAIIDIERFQNTVSGGPFENLQQVRVTTSNTGIQVGDQIIIEGAGTFSGQFEVQEIDTTANTIVYNQLDLPVDAGGAFGNIIFVPSVSHIFSGFDESPPVSSLIANNTTDGLDLTITSYEDKTAFANNIGFKARSIFSVEITNNIKFKTNETVYQGQSDDYIGSATVQSIENISNILQKLTIINLEGNFVPNLPIYGLSSEAEGTLQSYNNIIGLIDQSFNQIISVDVDAGGSGYANNSTLLFQDDFGSGALARITTTTTGEANNITVIRGGKNYTSLVTAYTANLVTSVTFSNTDISSTDLETISISHSFQNQDAVTFTQGSGSVTGLINGNVYYIREVAGTESFKLSNFPSGTIIDTYPATGTGHQLTSVVTPGSGASFTVNLGNPVEQGGYDTYIYGNESLTYATLQVAGQGSDASFEVISFDDEETVYVNTDYLNYQNWYEVPWMEIFILPDTNDQASPDSALTGSDAYGFPKLLSADSINRDTGNTKAFNAGGLGVIDFGQNTLTISGHGFAEARLVGYSANNQDFTSNTASTQHIPYFGLAENKGYYIHVVDTNTIQFATDYDPDDSQVLLNSIVDLSLADGGTLINDTNNHQSIYPINNTIEDMLNIEGRTVGTVASIGQFNPGEDYSVEPTAIIFDELTYASGKSDYIFNLSINTPGTSLQTGERLLYQKQYVFNGTSDVDGVNEFIFVENNLLVGQAVIYQRGTTGTTGPVGNLNPGQTYYVHADSNSNKIKLEDSEGDVINISAVGSAETDFNHIIQEASFSVVARLKDKISDYKLSAIRLSFYGDADTFIGQQIKGESSGSTVDIISVEDLSSRSGLNAIIDTTVQSAEGTVKTLEITDSGFGYYDQEDITFQLENDTDAVIGTARVYTGKQGLGTGYYQNTKSYLSQDKYIYDGYYYQDYSYEVQTSVAFDRYKDMLKKVAHIAGSQMFGNVLVEDVIKVPPSAKRSTEYKFEFNAAANVDATADTIRIDLGTANTLSLNYLLREDSVVRYSTEGFNAVGDLVNNSIYMISNSNYEANTFSLVHDLAFSPITDILPISVSSNNITFADANSITTSTNIGLSKFSVGSTVKITGSKSGVNDVNGVITYSDVNQIDFSTNIFDANQLGLDPGTVTITSDTQYGFINIKTIQDYIVNEDDPVIFFSNSAIGSVGNIGLNNANTYYVIGANTGGLNIEINPSYRGRYYDSTANNELVIVGGGESAIATATFSNNEYGEIISITMESSSGFTSFPKVSVNSEAIASNSDKSISNTNDPSYVAQKPPGYGAQFNIIVRNGFEISDTQSGTRLNLTPVADNINTGNYNFQKLVQLTTSTGSHTLLRIN